MSVQNPVKAIRSYCLDCPGGSVNEVKLCVIPDCPLFAFRFGKNPHRKPRQVSEAQRETMRERGRLLAQGRRAGEAVSGS